ncbi:MAG: hypothetical protein QF741_01850 [Candidatus Peribacteraceae bacterium]|jgi:hypothetical protein|nr:hypothetical protein [Candidatus Peribacteraceae bacterium]MDP7454230.1 hypothetical protein [Candidatus Peribacteraceae bacterium]
MNIFSKVLLPSLLIFLPSLVLAVFVSPGNLILSSAYNGKPTEFDYKLYIHANHPKDEEMDVSRTLEVKFV